MTAPVVAYTLSADSHGPSLTFCPDCALASTRLALIAAGVGLVHSMDEAIAAMALTQIERGLDVDTPVAVTTAPQEACDACERPLSGASSEVA